MPAIDWYQRCDEIRNGMIFKTVGGGIVLIDGRVPGDGTRMYVADRYRGDWCYQDSTAEPCDLVGEPMTEADLVASEVAK